MTAAAAAGRSAGRTAGSRRTPHDTLRLRHAIEHAAHLLPSQGPITVFVHHNTLHAFEDMPFDEAVRQGGQRFGCNPYLPEERYREALVRGRIRPSDLRAVLREDLGDRAEAPVPPQGNRGELRMAMLEHALPSGPTTELKWHIAQTEALRRIRADVPAERRERFVAETRRWIMRDVRNGNAPPHDAAMRARLDDVFDHYGAASIERWSDATWEAFSLRTLWRVCRDGTADVKAFVPGPPIPVRHRDLLLDATGADSDALVHEVLIRFCAAFLDQGFAQWPLPQRHRGFFRAFVALYARPAGPPDRWMRALAADLRRLESAGTDPLDSIFESLEILGVEEAEWEEFLSATLLALRGWAGMIRQIEERGDRVPQPVPEGSLLEYLAVRLVLERHALAHLASESMGYEEPLERLRAALRPNLELHRTHTSEHRAFHVFQIAQILGWTPELLRHLDAGQWSALVSEIESFSGIERRRLFHLAYERRYMTELFDALSVHARRRPERVAAPRFQAMFCIDDREESFRRHLEEIEPRAETFAAAGFYNIPIYFKGASDAHFTALCPIVMRPQHWVVEEVVTDLEAVHRRRTETRRVLGRIAHGLHLASRTLVGGFVSAGLGVMATVPLVGRILFPNLVARVRRRAGSLVNPPSRTRLRLERSEPTTGPEEGHVGFTVEEMADAAERLLRDVGLTSGFARLVLIFGHGSTSLNNPHMSAYGCGACSGAAGGPNARGICQMLNDPRVRALLAQRGLSLPEETWFVGGLHNTCKDLITVFDEERIPESHREEFAAVREILQQTCERNAHERCRRFESAPLTLSPAAAWQHVEGRSEDLAQTRPELGHVTNAATFVGRRARIRGLFLDRRVFITDYDPTQDEPDTPILLRLLQAAIPVCAGIGLEYFFSHVDSAGYGCGTKLPHNVASLLGVMDGAASDLRTGLPWQMVEIHEPLRPIFVIETTPEAMLSIMDRNEAIGRLCRNGWIWLAVLDPLSAAIQVFRNGRFEAYQPETTQLPQAASSGDWYRGWRDHLGFAQIGTS